MLVSRGADKSCKDKLGYTPLHAAAASGHIEIVKYLLRMGAEVTLLLLLKLVSVRTTNLNLSVCCWIISMTENTCLLLI